MDGLEKDLCTTDWDTRIARIQELRREYFHMMDSAVLALKPVSERRAEIGTMWLEITRQIVELASLYPVTVLGHLTRLEQL
jgi:hypothetical protein